jgi:type I restriction enzyme R subunit
VVDRQDLDYQTMKEYDKFEKGAANATKNTTELAKKIFSIQDNSKIIITTIQKLNNFINQQKEKKDSVFQKKIVFIFDECHRSQFGIYHTNIVKSFKNYYIFGFTGTPIFSDNSSKPELLTTEGCFGEKLHTYSIVNAIKDKNVLPFRVEYNNTIKANEEIENKKVLEIDTENALLSPIRIKKITEYILKNFSRKTSRNTYDSSKGFNSLFCVSSIEGAKKYYEEFKKQQDDKPLNERLKITTIFSYVANENEADLSLVDEDNESVSNLDKTSKEFLKTVIKDYNEQFKVTNSIEDFKNFYKDVSQNLKEKKLDLVIVVNMFLTGFDAPKLNTL